MSRQALDELKQQIPLLDYLQAHDWRPSRQLSRGRLMGLPTPITNQASWWIPARACSTATAVVAAVT